MSSLPVERVSVAEPIPGERARAAAPAPEPEGGGLSAQASSTPDAAQRTGTLRLVRAALLLLIGAGAHVWLDRWHRPEPPSALASVPIVTQAPAPAPPASAAALRTANRPTGPELVLRLAARRSGQAPSRLEPRRSRPASLGGRPSPRLAPGSVADDRAERADGRTPGTNP